MCCRGSTPSHAAQQADHAPQHFDLLAADGVHRVVLRLQADVVGLAKEPLHGGLLPQQRDHDVTILGYLLGPHDDEIHESTLRIRLWFRHHVTRNFWEDVEPGVEPEVEFEDPALATELP